MAGRFKPPDSLLPLSGIDAICDRFEAEIRAGKKPKIEDFLGDTPDPARSALFSELLSLELHYRAAAGETPKSADYWERFPDHLAAIADAFPAVETHAVPDRATARPDSAPLSPPALHVRCPHCRNPIEILDDTPLAQITCTACGSKFSLVGDEALAHQTTCGTLRRRQRFGHFELIEQLGSGGFGAVWKARDTQLDRIVAVKIPRKGQLNREETEMFLREARAAAQLRHPNIVTVHEVGIQDGTIYIVSDFVEGLTLAEWLTGKRLGYREAAELCVKIAEALHHAHEHGVIHRDLKPNNIVLDAEGEPHLMDFGLAKREAGEITMTVEGQILGTPAYMSPEQARGEGHTVDRRTDVYSLGVVLFQLLTGELPFRGSFRMLIKQVVEDPPPRPRRLDNHVPRDLETICLKCLEKGPNGRYPTARDVADELRRHLRGEPIRARPIGRMERAWRWCRRYPWMAGLSSAVGILLALVAVVGVVGYLQTTSALHLARQHADEADSERKVAQQAAQREQDAREAEAAERAKAEATLADTYMSTGLVAGERGNHLEAALWFASAAQLSKNDLQRREANRIRVETFLRESPRLVRMMAFAGGSPGRLEFHPSGKWLLVSAAQGCFVWDLQSDVLVDLAVPSESTGCAQWSPDGKTLALGRNDADVEIWEFPPGKRLHRIAFPGPVTAVEFDGAGSLLAIAGREVRVWDCVAGEYAGPTFEHPAPVRHLAFDRAGHCLVTASDDHKVRMFRRPENEKPWRAEPTTWPNLSYSGRGLARPCFVDEGRGLLTLGNVSAVTWWDLATGKKAREIPAARGLITSFDATPDGRYCLVAGIAQLDLWDAEEARRLCGLSGGHVGWPASSLSGDGRLLVSGTDMQYARLWSLPAGQPLTPPLRHGGPIQRVKLSHDGRLFATAQPDGVVCVWQTARATASGCRIPVQRVDAANCFAATTDGKFVLAQGDECAVDAVRVYQTATGEPACPPLETEGTPLNGDFSPSGDRLLACSAGGAGVGSVQAWDWKSEKRMWKPLETPFLPLAVAWSPDAKSAAVVGSGGDVLLLDARSGGVLGRRRHEGPPWDGRFPAVRLRFAPDGVKFVTFSFGEAAWLWESSTLRTIHRLSTGSTCLDARFSHDGRRLVTASVGGQARVWDVASGTPAGPLLMHTDFVFAARFSPDDRLVVTACRDRAARVWDWSAGRLVCPMLEHAAELTDAAFFPSGSWVLSAGREGTATIWDARTGKPLSPPQDVGRFHPPESRPHFSHRVEIAVDGSKAAVFFRSREVFLFDTSHLADSPIAGLASEDQIALTEINANQEIHPGGGLVLLSSEQRLRRWEAFAAKHPEFHRLPGSASTPAGGRGTSRARPKEPLVLSGHQGAVGFLAFDPGGQRLYSASIEDRDEGAPGRIMIWDLKKGNNGTEWLSHRPGFYGGSVSPDWKQLALGCRNGEIAICDLNDPRSLRRLPAHATEVWTARYSPDGRRIVSATKFDGTIKVWDVASHKETLGLALSRRNAGRVMVTWINGVSFSPDGKRIAAPAEGDSVKVFDAQTGEVAFTLAGHEPWANGVAFSHDGKRLSVVTDSGQVVLWDLGTRRPAAVLRAHTGPAIFSVFSPDSRLLASTGFDGIVRLWDTQRCRSAGVLRGHTSGCSSAAFSSDGNRLAVGSWDHTIRVWDVPRLPSGHPQPTNAEPNPCGAKAPN